MIKTPKIHKRRRTAVAKQHSKCRPINVGRPQPQSAREHRLALQQINTAIARIYGHGGTYCDED